MPLKGISAFRSHEYVIDFQKVLLWIALFLVVYGDDNYIVKTRVKIEKIKKYTLLYSLTLW